MIDSRSTARTYALLLFVCASLIFLLATGRRHFWNPDEPRVAGIGAEMARTGEVVVPRLNAEPFLEKPPLYFWSLAGSFRLFGLNHFAGRFPSAAAAIGGILLVFLLARAMGFSARGAFLAGFILATSMQYWYIGHRCISDMVLTFFTTAAMVSYYLALQPAARRAAWSIGFVVALSCAVLTKGLVGLAVPLCALGAWLLAERDFSLRAWLLLTLGSALCLLPAAGWAWLLYRDLGWDAMYEVVWMNNFGRFTGGHDSHVRPFYYYFLNMPMDFLPWTLFLGVAVKYYAPQLFDRQAGKAARFLAAWLFVPFLLLSISSGKRGLYALPLFPAAALLVGTAMGAILERDERPTKWLTVPLVILIAFITAVPLVFLGVFIYFKLSFVLWPLVTLPGLLIAVAAWRLLLRRDFAGTLWIVVTALVVLLVTTDAAILPVFNRFKSHVPLFNYCKTLEAEGAQIGLYEPKETMRGAAYFYLGQTVPVMTDSSELADFVSQKRAVVIGEKGEERKIENPRVLDKFEIGHRTMVVFSAGDFKPPEP